MPLIRASREESKEPLSVIANHRCVIELTHSLPSSKAEKRPDIGFARTIGSPGLTSRLIEELSVRQLHPALDILEAS